MAEDEIPPDVWIEQQVQAWREPVREVFNALRDRPDYLPMDAAAWEHNAPTDEGIDGAVECRVCGELAYSVAAGACLECGAGNEP